MFREIEDLDIFKQIEALCDVVWDVVINWNDFEKQAVGLQLVKSLDSVGANLVEGDGRFHAKDKLDFLYMARGSLKEARFWIKRSVARKLLTAKEGNEFINEIVSVLKQINTIIRNKREQLEQSHQA